MVSLSRTGEKMSPELNQALTYGVYAWIGITAVGLIIPVTFLIIQAIASKKSKGK